MKPSASVTAPSSAPPVTVPAFERKMTDFLDLSDDLLSLLRHENAILGGHTEAASHEAYILRKVELMGKFEKSAQELLHLVTLNVSLPHSSKIAVISEVTKVRDALNMNARIQMARLKARKEMDFKRAINKGDVTCH